MGMKRLAQQNHIPVLRVLEDVMVKHTVGDLGRGAAKGWAIGQL